MKKLIKRMSAAMAAIAITLNASAFAADFTPEEKAETFLLLTRTGSATGSDMVTNLQNNMNRYSPLAMGTSTDSGRDAYYFTNNTASTIQVTWDPPTFYHRVMAHKSFTSLNTLVKDFENNVLRFSVAAGPRFVYIARNEDDRRNIKIGLSYTKSGGINATDAKFVQLADYVDLVAMQNNQYQYFDVEIPVKDIIDSEDFYAFNGSASTGLDPDNINGVTIAMEINGDKSAAKVMYMTDMYLAYVPAAPTDLWAEQTSDSATLYWDYENPDDISFNIFRDGEYIATTTDMTYTDTGLQPETEYLYQVQAQNGDTASKSVECVVKTNEFFSDPPLTEAGFMDISINGSIDLKHQKASNENRIEGRLFSENYSGSATVIAAAYNNGVMTDVGVSLIDSVAQSGSDFMIELGAADTVKFFAVDSLENLRLISQVGVLTTEAFYEKRIPPEDSAVNDFDVNFVSDVSGFDISCDARDTFVALALKDGTDAASVSEVNAAEKIAAVDVCEADADKLRLIFDHEKFSDDYYIFDVSEAKCPAKREYYAGQDTIAEFYKDLNDPHVSAEKVRECIESPVLNLDLTDYKRVDRNKVIDLFMELKPKKIESVADIKGAFDEAVGTVLFCSAVEKSDADLVKYGSYLGIDPDDMEEVTGKLSRDTNAFLYKILAEKSCEIDKEAAVTLFEEALLCAKASSKDNTWAMLRDVVSGIVDESLIPSYVDVADVYKAMLKIEYKSIEAIQSRFKASINAQKNAASSGTSGGGGGGGGGGGNNSSSTGTMYTSSGAGVVQAPSATAAPGTLSDTSATQSPYTGELFTDVPASHWAYDGVYTLLDENIVSEDTRFRPNDPITREEFVKMLVMIFKPVADKELPFEDVHEGDWFYPYIRAAYSAGIVSGVSDTQFGTGQNITRQDMAKMLYNAIQNMSALLELDTENMTFTDADEISDYAKDAMAYLNAAGLMTGDDEGRANPLSNATRAECAAMLSRYVNNDLIDRTYPDYGVVASVASDGSGAVYEPESYKSLRELLTAFEITSSEDKNYNAPMSRGEFCDMVARLIDLTYFEPSEYYYNDVPRTHPYSQSIYSLSEYGVVSGNDAGNFLPDEPITANQAAAIVVRALGYTEMMLSNQNFPEAYLTKANDLKLFKKVSTKGENALSRSDAYMIIKNALDASVPEVSVTGKSTTYVTDKDNTAAWVFHNVIKAKGICNANYISTLTGSKSSGMEKGRIRIDGDMYIVNNPDYNYYLGYNLEYYYEDESKEILFMEPYENTVVEIDYDDVVSFSGSSIKYSVNNRNKTANLSGNADMVYNGAAYPGYDPADFTEARFDSRRGRIVLVDNDDDNKYDCICIEEYITYVVNYATEDDYMLYFRNYNETDHARSVSFKDADYVEVTRPNGYELPFASMLTNEAATVFETYDGKYVRIICSAEKLNGTVVTNNVDTLTVRSGDGITAEYDLDVRDSDTMNALKPGYKGAMILNYKGEISGVVDQLNEGQVYAYMMKAYLDEAEEGKVFFKLLCEDGQIRILTADSKTQVDGAKYSDTNALYEKFIKTDKSTGITYTNRQIVHYTPSEDNTAIGKMDTGELGSAEDPATTMRVEHFSSGYYRPAHMYIQKKVQLDINGLIIFVVPNVTTENVTDSDFSVRYNLHNWWTEESINMDTVITDKDGMTSTCAAVYYNYETNKGIGGNKLYYNMKITTAMVDEVRYKVNENGDTVPEIYLVTESAITPMECAWMECAQKAVYDEEGNLVDGKRGELSRGDVIRYRVDDNGIIQYTECVCDASRIDNKRFSKGTYTSTSEVFCMPYSKSGKGLRLSSTVLPGAPNYDRTDPLATIDISDEAMFMTIWPESTIKIFVYDSKNKTVRKGNIFDVKDFKNNPNDTSLLYFRESYSVPSVVCIYN